MSILYRTAAGPRARKTRKFTPGTLIGETGVRLEGRALAAPVFFRFANSTDIVYSQTQGQYQPVVTDSQPVTASTSGRSEEFQMGQSNSVFTSSGMAQAIDGGVTPTGAAPVFRANVGGNTNSWINATTPGFIPGLYNGLGVFDTWNRTYDLADDTAFQSGPATLTEHFNVYYSPSNSSTYASSILVGFGSPAASSTNGPSINIHGSNTGVTGVVVDGNLQGSVYAGSTGNFVMNNATTDHTNSTVYVSASSTTVLITTQTYFPNGVPSVFATTPNSGIKWPVGVSARLNLGGNVSAGASAMTSLNTHYDAAF